MHDEVFGAQWVEAWREEIRASADYRMAARKWEWSVLLLARADPERGVLTDRHVYLELRHGECREARLGSAADTVRATFVLAADAGTWLEVIAGRLDAVGGVAGGRITLEKGSLMSLAMHAGAAKALIATASRVGR